MRLELGDRAFAYWDPGDPDWPALVARLRGSAMDPEDPGRPTTGAWTIDPGRYELQVGRSAADIAYRVPVQVSAGARVAG